MSTLTGQTAIVTGAGSGIGRAIALALADAGACVWFVGRTLEKLERAAACTGEPGRAVTSAADLAIGEDIAALTDRFRREASSLDILVHSAGEISLGPIESARAEDLDRLYEVNLRAPLLLTQRLLPLLRARRGQVVFINSSAGLAPSRNNGLYAATKSALKALADSLRAEVNVDGIRVLSVYPGRTATAMQAYIHQEEGSAYRPDALAQPEDVAELVVGALTLPRTAEVTDLSVRPMRKPQ